MGGVGNLRVPSSAFFGRQADLARIEDLLGRPLTIAGPAGCGKTRLALELAHRCADRYPDGTWFVGLSTMAAGSDIWNRVCDVLGVSGPEAAVARVGSLRALVVLDNAEHVASGAAQVVDAFGGSAVHVLCTSRSAVGSTDEVVVRLDPLALPDDEGDAAASPAVALFLDRARQARRDVVVDAPAIVQAVRICRTVAGLPLGIELAAARSAFLSLADVADRLPATGGIEDAIDASLSLLSEDDRRLFATLGVFAGSPTLAAVEAVSGTEDVASAMARLVDHSLVSVGEVAGRTRYRMLPVVAQRAWSLAAERRPELRRRHLAAYAAPAAAATGEALANDLDDLRQALDTAIDLGRAEPALRVALAIARGVTSVGNLDEGRRILRRALEMDGPGHLRLEALLRLASMHGEQVALDDAERAYAEAERLAAELADARAAIAVSLGRASCAQRAGDAPRARMLAEQALVDATRLELAAEQAAAEELLGHLDDGAGNLTEARDHATRAMEIYHRLGDMGAVARTLVATGNLLCTAGSFADARERLREALGIARGIGDRRAVLAAHLALGGVEHASGRLDAAREAYSEGLEVARAIRADRGAAICLGNLAMVAEQRGALIEARRLAEEALRRRASVDVDAEVLLMSAAARIASKLGDLDAAWAAAADAWEQTGRANLRTTGDVAITRASIAVLRGDPGEAVRMATEAVELETAYGDRTYLAIARGILADALWRAGERDRARRELEAALPALEGTDSEPDALELRAGWVLDEGDNAAAAAFAQRAWRLRSSAGMTCARPLEILALAWHDTDPLRAAKLLGAADAERDASADPGPADQAAKRRRLREQLASAGYGPAVDAGRSLDAPSVSGLVGSPPTNPAPAPAAAVLRRTDGGWTITYRDAVSPLPDTRGLRHLARLLAEPGREWHVLDLAAEGAGAVRGEDAGPVLDAQAKAAFKRRLADLEAQEAEARAWGDATRAERAAVEREAIVRQLAAAVGLGGRDRPAAANAERARVAVRKAITKAIAKIAGVHPDLGSYLTTTVRTGAFCSYVPDPRAPIAWTVRAAPSAAASAAADDRTG